MELTFDALSKNYGKKQALIGFSAELTGGIYGLLGPNGAGKSTLMNILTGNLRQTAGEIRFNGAEIRSLGAAFRGRVGYMPQQQTLYPGFTAERFLLYMASLRRMPRARARSAMRSSDSATLAKSASGRSATVRYSQPTSWWKSSTVCGSAARSL